MNKEFQSKIMRKRIRRIGIIIIVLIGAFFVFRDMRVEKADYTDSLKSQIEKAQDALMNAEGNEGNEEGQYAPYTLLDFKEKIKTAEMVFNDESSGYEDKKTAYETLKEDTRKFTRCENTNVISAKDVKKIMKSGKTETVKDEIKEGSPVEYTIDSSKIYDPVSINFMVKEKGPMYDKISEILSKEKIKGQVVSFYQDGTFGATIKVKIHGVFIEKREAKLYRFDFEKSAIEYAGKVKTDVKDKSVTFDVTEGGDYIVAFSEVDDKKINAEIKKNKKDTGKEDKETPVKKEDKDKKDPVSQTTEKDDNIKVTVEIRCTEIAEDLSKLTNDAVKDYIPDNGIILSQTAVTVEKGKSAYAVLEKVCRNNGIHMEASYTPAYGSYYVEGINYLYEFDAGSTSGWMYKVNGKFPNYGSSSYKVKNGDIIVWEYTCNLGRDVGNVQ